MTNYKPACFNRAFYTQRQALCANKSWTKKAVMVNTARPMSPVSCLRKWFILTGLLVAFPALILSLSNAAMVEGEYALSGPLIGDQTAPRAALWNSGGFAVWQDNGIDGSGLGIGGRRLDANQSPAGTPFRVNELTAGDQERPAIAALNAGGAAVAWLGGRQGYQNIFARFLNADGSFSTGDIAVNPLARSSNSRVTTNWVVIRNNRATYRTQRIKRIVDQKQERNAGVAVATLNDGTVVVGYASGRRIKEKIQMQVPTVRFIHRRFVTNSVLQFVETEMDSMQDVYFQLFTAAGQKIGEEIRANQTVQFNQSQPSIASLSDGTFMLVWSSEQQTAENNIDVVGRWFDSNGHPLGNEFLVDTSVRPCGSPAIAGHAEGGFTVAWSQKNAPGMDSLDIYARTFNPSALPITDAFRVNTHTFGDQFSPSIVAALGSQVIVWTSLGQDGSRDGVYSRSLNNGAFAGSEFRVNTTTLLRQFHPHVAADPAGNFLTLWSSYQTTAGFDLFGQRSRLP